MKKVLGIIFAISMSTMFSAAAHSQATVNTVYIDQVGSNSTIDITQTGINNVAGDATTSLRFNGNSQNVTMTQVGNLNVAAVTLNGTGSRLTSNITGDNNNVTVNCGTAVGSSCNDTTIEANATGSYNTLTTTAGSKSTIKTNIDNDGNGHNNVSINSATTNLLGANVDVSLAGGSSGGGTNSVSVNQSGPGFYDTKVAVTGGQNTIGVTQSGNVDSTVNIKSNGSGNTITVRSGN